MTYQIKKSKKTGGLREYDVAGNIIPPNYWDEFLSS
jgi:hypothetical protein